MTDETGGKPLFCENARIVLSEAALTELIAAAEELCANAEARIFHGPGYRSQPEIQTAAANALTGRLRAAVARVRGE
jgi:hypothetical protein